MDNTHRLMSSIIKSHPELTNAELLKIAEAIDPLPEHIKRLTDTQLLTILSPNYFKKETDNG